MLYLLVWAASAAVVLGGQSPSANYIDELVTSGARFSDNVIEDAKLDVPELVAKYGYPIEVHNVITEDSYILTLHRIPRGRDQNSQPGARPVVFIMHGLLSSSAEFVLLGPGNALAYTLAEEGYDVWLGNARGNYYSRRHAGRLNPDRHRDFWRFSWDEIGNLDLPASIDYIEKVTGQPRLHYIGHSQGGTTFFVLNTLRPEYNKKFISFQGLAPGAFFGHNEHKVYKLLAPRVNVIEPAVFAATRGEVMRNREWVTWFGSRYCYEGSTFSPLCVALVEGFMSPYFNQTLIPLILGHAPAGASIRQLSHYGQLINNGNFRRYDHNPIRNLVLYGSRTPPDYDLSLITVPSHIHYSLSDSSAHWKDIELLETKLQNVVLHKVESPYFDHFDFVWGNGVRKLYDYVISIMKQADQDL